MEMTNTATAVEMTTATTTTATAEKEMEVKIPSMPTMNNTKAIVMVTTTTKQKEIPPAPPLPNLATYISAKDVESAYNDRIAWVKKYSEDFLVEVTELEAERDNAMKMADANAKKELAKQCEIVSGGLDKWVAVTVALMTIHNEKLWRYDDICENSKMTFAQYCEAKFHFSTAYFCQLKNGYSAYQQLKEAGKPVAGLTAGYCNDLHRSCKASGKTAVEIWEANSVDGDAPSLKNIKPVKTQDAAAKTLAAAKAAMGAIRGIDFSLLPPVVLDEIKNVLNFAIEKAGN